AEDGIRDATVTGVQTCALPISRVQHEFRCARQGVDLVHRCFQGPRDVRIGWLVESHVAVADLYKAQFSLGPCGVQVGKTAQAVRSEERRVGKVCSSHWT